VINKNKEKDIFNWMVSNYYNKVLKTALFYLKNRREAEDITQDVFLKAFHKIDFSKTEESKFPILYTITKNLSLNRIKSSGWNVESLPEWDISTNIANPEKEYLRKEQMAQINESLSSLKQELREVLILKHYQDCSYSEIAEILSIPKGTVMSRLYTGRRSLEKKLKGVIYG
jgi:RNA polymerase sigma-70 factor, ECF subfamily